MNDETRRAAFRKKIDGRFAGNFVIKKLWLVSMTRLILADVF